MIEVNDEECAGIELYATTRQERDESDFILDQLYAQMMGWC